MSESTERDWHASMLHRRRVAVRIGLCACGLAAFVTILSGFWHFQVDINSGYRVGDINVYGGMVKIMLGSRETRGNVRSDRHHGSYSIRAKRIWFWWPWGLRENRQIGVKYTEVKFPVWTGLLIAIGLTTAAWLRVPRARRGHCRNCGYNLTGATSEKCSECGASTAYSVVPVRKRRTPIVVGVIVFLLIGLTLLLSSSVCGAGGDWRSQARLDNLEKAPRLLPVPEEVKDGYLEIVLTLPQRVDMRKGHIQPRPVVASVEITNVMSFPLGLFHDGSGRTMCCLRFESVSLRAVGAGRRPNAHELLLDLGDVLAEGPQQRGWRVIQPGETIEASTDIGPILRLHYARTDVFGVRVELRAAPVPGELGAPYLDLWHDRSLLSKMVTIDIERRGRRGGRK